MFEFTNDTTDFATLQLTREDLATTNSSSGGTTGTTSANTFGGPMIRLFPKDSVSLVLNAGATYHYLVKQTHRKAQISIRTWRDTKCSTSDVLSGNVSSNGPSISEGAQRTSPWTPLSQNVTVVCLPAPTSTTSSSSSWED
ncbi:hypothetical protein FA13DRAFT_1427801 [Coprinellus micaceus]|uniref:Uncharacterized protein n=1 Tax=Coprinellus micaceus TaxID=71717 RepID=A0A4Y7TN45_COPMI|nr:hypothetical protein FA13DRAFT_1427801 [Coprinellus micaceus]